MNNIFERKKAIHGKNSSLEVFSFDQVLPRRCKSGRKHGNYEKIFSGEKGDFTKLNGEDEIWATIYLKQQSNRAVRSCSPCLSTLSTASTDKCYFTAFPSHVHRSQHTSRIATKLQHALLSSVGNKYYKEKAQHMVIYLE